MKVLVTGVKGQLGFDVMRELSKRGIEGVGVDIDEMDINDDCNVSINDVMQLVNIILEKDSTKP